MSSEVGNVIQDQNADGEITQTEIQNILKGDAIGDTMYTQRFVLKTLLKLKDLEWGEELEEDLCFLWDSTVEKEVCCYLMEINFPSIACSVILEYNTSEYGRLSEILVGIIANIVTAKCEKQLNAAQVDVILSLLVSTDSLVLVQVMRFIISFCNSSNDLTFLTDERGEDVQKSIKFILTSSINFELIQKAIEAVANITQNLKIELFFESEILTAAMTGCIRSVTEDEENDFELFTSGQRNTVKHLMEYILNFCVYLNQEGNVLGSEVCSNSCIQIFSKLCEWYSVQENLLPITNELSFFFEASNYIFSTLKVDYIENIFKNLILIVKILIDNECEDISEFIEMFCYFIHKANEEQMKKTFTMALCVADIKKICKYLEQQNSVHYDFRIEKLKNLYHVI